MREVRISPECVATDRACPSTASVHPLRRLRSLHCCGRVDEQKLTRHVNLSWLKVDGESGRSWLATQRSQFAFLAPALLSSFCTTGALSITTYPSHSIRLRPAFRERTRWHFRLSGQTHPNAYLAPFDRVSRPIQGQSASTCGRHLFHGGAQEPTCDCCS